LQQIKDSGAQLIACGVAMKALVSDITRTIGSMAAMAILLIAVQPVHAQEPLRLTLKDAVTLALKQNPQIAIANLNLAESQENQNVARSALLPQVGFGAGEKLTRGNVEALLGKKIPGFAAHVGPFWTMQSGVQISTPVFDLTLWRRWQAARESIGAT